MLQKRILELWVGIFVTVGLLALAMLAFQVAGLATADVADGYRIIARFDNIGGLKVKSPVTMAGVRVGRVASIGFDHERYQALVAMNIDGRYHAIPEDTTASILTSGLLGEQYVGLGPGGSEIYFKDGGEIQITQSALVLENLVGQLVVSLTGGSEKEEK